MEWDAAEKWVKTPPQQNPLGEKEVNPKHRAGSTLLPFDIMAAFTVEDDCRCDIARNPSVELEPHYPFAGF